MSVDERQSLAARLERGELRRAEVRALGRALAELHAKAPRAKPTGVPDLAVERTLAESVHELLAVVEQRAEIGHVLALERFAHAFVLAHARTLNARARRGSVREGLGDVADDLALLVMDLAARGDARYARYARSLVAGYREAGGEPGDDALIAFYAAHRALVRAKAELVRAAQHPSKSAAHGHHSALARDLLGLAERFAWQARLPLAIVVCGVPAGGTSQVAEALAELSGLAHLSAGTGRAPPAGGDLLAHASLGRRAARHVATHRGAIIQAALAPRSDRDAFRSAFGDGAPLLFVECQDAGGERPPWEPLDEVAPQAHLALRSDRPVDDVTADLLALLDQRIGLLQPPVAEPAAPCRRGVSRGSSA